MLHREITVRTVRGQLYMFEYFLNIEQSRRSGHHLVQRKAIAFIPEQGIVKQINLFREAGERRGGGGDQGGLVSSLEGELILDRGLGGLYRRV